MAKIFIDTMIFLDFYEKKTNPLPILDDVVKVRDKLVFTDQVVDEFWRKRESILGVVKRALETCRGRDYTTALLDTIPEFIETKQKLTEVKRLIGRVIEKVDNIIDDPSSDQVADRFSNLLNSSKPFPINEEIIRKAHQRLLAGNPPGSGSIIGDQINWEAILANLQDDLIVVSRDSTYSNNSSFLKREYKTKTGKTLLSITGKITDAISQVGEKPDDLAIKAEERLSVEGKAAVMEERIGEAERRALMQALELLLLGTCPRCGSSGQAAATCTVCGFDMGGD